MPRKERPYRIYRGDELKELVRMAKAGNSVAWKTLQKSMYVFVADVANQLQHNNHNRSYQFNDLVSQGMLGVKEALDKFDENQGVAFPSYAVWWIRHEINNFIDKNSSIVNASIEYARAMHGDYKYKQVVGGEWVLDEEHLENRYKKNDTPKEKKKANTKAKRIARGITSLNVASMDAHIETSEGPAEALSTYLPDKSLDVVYDSDALSRLVRLFCRGLTKQQKAVFRLRYLHGLSIKETMSQTGYSHDVVHTVSTDMLDRFREFVLEEGFESPADFVLYDPNEHLNSMKVK
jgi:RNA polymerase sigma factor (sigma-70 family)